MTRADLPRLAWRTRRRRSCSSVSSSSASALMNNATNIGCMLSLLTGPACPVRLRRIARPRQDGRWQEGRERGRRAAAPRHRQRAQCRCIAGSILARDDLPPRVRPCDPVLVRLGTAAGAGTWRPPELLPLLGTTKPHARQGELASHDPGHLNGASEARTRTHLFYPFRTMLSQAV